MQKLDKLFLCHPTCTTCKKVSLIRDNLKQENF